MTNKLNSTEAEFREAMEFALHVNTREVRPPTTAIVDFLKRHLDLEFREPEGRGEGEGLPRRLEVGAHYDGDPEGWHGWALLNEGDEPDVIRLPLAFVLGSRATAEAFRDAYNRGQDLPALLALARELEGELTKWRGPSRPDLSPNRRQAADALLARARDLLDRLEGDRP